MQSMLREILSRQIIRQKSMRDFQCVLCSCFWKLPAPSSVAKALLHHIKQRSSPQPTTNQTDCAATPI
jgi:hypothetical protein